MFTLNQTFEQQLQHFESLEDLITWTQQHTAGYDCDNSLCNTANVRTAKELLDTKCGNNCQVALLTKAVCDKLNYPTKTFYVKQNDSANDWGKYGQSHVLVVAQDCGQYFWVQPSLSYFRGIMPSPDLNSIFQVLGQQWCRNQDKAGLADTLEIRQVHDLPCNCTAQEWAQKLNNAPVSIKMDISGNPVFPKLLTQDTRTQLLAASRNRGDYKDKSRGKNRFQRKKYSKVGNAVKQYNSIDMNQLFKRDILLVKIPVVGQTDNYEVSIKLQGVIKQLAKNIKNNQNKLQYRTIIQAITKIFNTGNVYLHCTCDDFKYRFHHWSIVNDYSTQDTSKDPGPGKGIANPHDDKGKGCKHCLLVLNNLEWIMKVASVINNYIHYTEQKLPKPFLNIIFPKLYGIPADQMVEQGLIDSDKFLDSSKGLIDAINEYGKNRGKFKPGSNKNPITGTGGQKPKTQQPKTEQKPQAKKQQPKKPEEKGQQSQTNKQAPKKEQPKKQQPKKQQPKKEQPKKQTQKEQAKQEKK